MRALQQFAPSRFYLEWTPMSKPTIPEVIDRFRAYYRRVGWSWGSLHIVLSDDNVEDHFVQWCIGYAEENDDPEGAELARVLLTMSKTQRLNLGDKVSDLEGYPDAPGTKQPEPPPVEWISFSTAIRWPQ
jgi:hypothetical protein